MPSFEIWKSDSFGIAADELWQAIVKNDSTYDGKFYYGVKTTGIFCRPSCKSRVPNKENVLVFREAEQALSEEYRPCKRCRPNQLRLPDEDWAGQIAQYIDVHYSKPLTLHILADLFHGSPYHLQRIFKRVKGLTPTEYIQQLRIAKAIQYLTTTDQTIMKIGEAVGMFNIPYFVTLFKKKTGHTPSDFRNLYQGQLPEGDERQ